MLRALLACCCNVAITIRNIRGGTLVVLVCCWGGWRLALELSDFENLQPVFILTFSIFKMICLIDSAEFPTGLGIPPLEIKILLESNPLKSRILVRKLAVQLPPAATGTGTDTGTASQPAIQPGMAWHGTAQHGTAQPSPAQHSMARSSMSFHPPSRTTTQRGSAPGPSRSSFSSGGLDFSGTACLTLLV